MHTDLFSNWNLIRTFGFLAYYLLTLSILAGLMQRMHSFQRHRQVLMELHKISGWTGVLATVFHAALLLFNHHVRYSLAELLIPFASVHDPVSTAFGILSFYLLLFITATSDVFIKKLPRRLWKNLHWLVFPAWALSFNHGIFIGTDSEQVWAIAIYCTSFALIATFLAFRSYEKRVEKSVKKKQLL